MKKKIKNKKNKKIKMERRANIDTKSSTTGHIMLNSTIDNPNEN